MVFFWLEKKVGFVKLKLEVMIFLVIYFIFYFLFLFIFIILCICRLFLFIIVNSLLRICEIKVIFSLLIDGDVLLMLSLLRNCIVVVFVGDEREIFLFKY